MKNLQKGFAPIFIVLIVVAVLAVGAGTAVYLKNQQSATPQKSNIPQSAQTNQKSSITVLSPNGGEALEIGKTYTIQWTSQKIFSHVSVELYIEDIRTYREVIAEKISNTGKFLWAIPQDLPLAGAGGYIIRITACHYSNELKGVVCGAAGDPGGESKTFSITSSNVKPSITVLSPNGGEVLRGGTSQKIIWEGGGVDSTVDIFLLRTNTSCILECATCSCSPPVWKIATGLHNTGNYSWVVGTAQEAISINYTMFSGFGQKQKTTSIPQKSVFQIKICSSNGSCDISDSAFKTISSSDPIVTILSPNGGEHYRIGDIVDVRWNISSSSRSTFKLADLVISCHSCSTINILHIPNTGSYTWQIPSDFSPGTSYEATVNIFNVESAIEPMNYDDSDAPFTIMAAPAQPITITILSPNGGEVWQVGTKQRITWTAPASTQYVDIILTPTATNPGAEAAGGNVPVSASIARNIANSGSFEFTVPDVAAGTYKISVVSYASVTHNFLSDSSDAPFTITTQ